MDRTNNIQINKQGGGSQVNSEIDQLASSLIEQRASASSAEEIALIDQAIASLGGSERAEAATSVSHGQNPVKFTHHNLGVAQAKANMSARPTAKEVTVSRLETVDKKWNESTKNGVFTSFSNYTSFMSTATSLFDPDALKKEIAGQI